MIQAIVEERQDDGDASRTVCEGWALSVMFRSCSCEKDMGFVEGPIASGVCEDFLSSTIVCESRGNERFFSACCRMLRCFTFDVLLIVVA